MPLKRKQNWLLAIRHARLDIALRCSMLPGVGWHLRMPIQAGARRSWAAQRPPGCPQKMRQAARPPPVAPLGQAPAAPALLRSAAAARQAPSRPGLGLPAVQALCCFPGRLHLAQHLTYPCPQCIVTAHESFLY